MREVTTINLGMFLASMAIITSHPDREYEFWGERAGQHFEITVPVTIGDLGMRRVCFTVDGEKRRDDLVSAAQASVHVETVLEELFGGTTRIPKKGANKPAEAPALGQLGLF
jgi:hypothetical protein